MKENRTFPHMPLIKAPCPGDRETRMSEKRPQGGRTRSTDAKFV